MKFNHKLILLLTLIDVVFSWKNLRIKPWMNKMLSPEERAKILLSKMLLSEKIDMLHGTVGEYVGNVKKNTRLGIPALKLNDGP